MTESDWLEVTDPAAMLAFLRDNSEASKRKLRLFAAACCRRIPPIMSEEVNRAAVEVAERFADGEATEQELGMAWDAVGRVAVAFYTTFDTARRGGKNPAEAGIQVLYSHNAALAASNPDRVDPAANAAENAVAILAEDDPDAERTERTAQANLIRCIFGNPFRPILIDPVWRSATVEALAHAAYDEQVAPDPSRPGWLTLDPARLAVLADALEEAGCTATDLLGHLRGRGPHVRGCWVVDLFTGRE